MRWGHRVHTIDFLFPGERGPIKSSNTNIMAEDLDKFWHIGSRHGGDGKEAGKMEMCIETIVRVLYHGGVYFDSTLKPIGP